MSNLTYNIDKNGILVRTSDDSWGLKTRTVYQPIMVIEERNNCYCCSCHETDYSTINDPYCRNHGFVGIRKCEEHAMPGDSWEVDFDTVPPKPDVILLTVQQERARRG